MQRCKQKHQQHKKKRPLRNRQTKIKRHKQLHKWHHQKHRMSFDAL